jgi:hypothetical protein
LNANAEPFGEPRQSVSGSFVLAIPRKTSGQMSLQNNFLPILFVLICELLTLFRILQMTFFPKDEIRIRPTHMALFSIICCVTAIIVWLFTLTA